jgi:hypothetical protein
MQALAQTRVLATAAPTVARAQRRTTSKVVATADKSTGVRGACRLAARNASVAS